MADSSRFFDDEGNLIATSWEIEAEEKAERERKLAQEKADTIRKKDLNKKLNLSERQAQFAEAHSAEMKRRAQREKWNTYPDWIKKMPRTPMDAPPTEGKKEKMLTKLTGKTHLTDSELSRRKAQRARLKKSIEVYERINASIHPSEPIVPVSVISFEKGTGGTSITRAISRALAESRGNISRIISVDAGDKDNDFNKWFARKLEPTQLYVKFYLNLIKDPSASSQLGYDVLPRSTTASELYLSNASNEARRVRLSVQDIIDIYRSVQKTYGFLLFDVAAHDKRDARTYLDSAIDNYSLELITAALSKHVVFVLGVSQDSQKMLDKFFTDLAFMLDSDLGEANSEVAATIERIKNNCTIVVTSVIEQMSTGEAKDIIPTFLRGIARKSGIADSALTHIAYDKNFATAPLMWEKMAMKTKHSMRLIAARIVDSVAAHVE